MQVSQKLALMILAIALAAGGVNADHVVSDSFLKVLKDNDVTYTPQDVSRQAELAVARTIDSKAVIVSRKSALEMASEWPPVEYAEQWPRGILYIKCVSLNDGAYDAITNAYLACSNGALHGVVLDLRGAGGWDLPELEKVASCFLPEGSPLCRIMTGEGRVEQTLRASEPRLIENKVPVVLLIDKSTDGTAEIIAGVLAERDGVMVMGREAANGGRVRKFLPLGKGEYLFITTGWADWGDGVKSAVVPDIKVASSLDQHVPEPSRAGRQPGDLLELLSKTASDEMKRRATDIILSRMRLKDQPEDASGIAESK